MARRLALLGSLGVTLAAVGIAVPHAAAKAPPGGCDPTACNDPYAQAGTVASGQTSRLVGVRCGGDKPYVERGANQTVAKFKAQLDWPLVVVGVIAVSTVENQFGSRAVTSYLIYLERFPFTGDEPLNWVVRWFCTSQKNNAWLVFG